MEYIIIYIAFLLITWAFTTAFLKATSMLSSSYHVGIYNEKYT